VAQASLLPAGLSICWITRPRKVIGELAGFGAYTEDLTRPIGEAVQLSEPDRAVAGFDISEYAAGADRRELLVITYQPDTAAATDELHGSIQRQGVGHPGFVDDHQAGPADTVSPVGQVIVVDGPGEFRQRFGWCRSAT
jgi:hypothetical protein